MRKKFSTYYHVLPHTTTYYHVLQQNVVFASRTANLACRPSYSTVLLFCYFTPDTVLPRPMFGVGRPRCKKVFHVLPRTTTYYSVLRSFCISDGQPCMSALLFYCFTVLLFHCRYSTAAADVWGWPPEMQKSFPSTTTYVLQQNVVFASRTANLACRPSYSTILLFYYFTILLFYCFTILLQIQYCRGRCLGLAARDAKKFSTYYHVLQQNVVFCISDGQPCMSALVLLFYYFTVSLQIQFCRGRCLGLARDAKQFSTYYHVVGRPRCKNSAADVCGWPPEKICGRCLRLAVRDAKNSAADVCGWASEIQKTLRPMFAVGCPRCKKLCGRCLRLTVRDAKNSDPQTSAAEFFASRTANRKHRPQSFCISDGQPQTSVAEFLHLGRPTANIGLKVFASRTAIPACRPAFLHVGRTHPSLEQAHTAKSYQL